MSKDCWRLRQEPIVSDLKFARRGQDFFISLALISPSTYVGRSRKFSSSDALRMSADPTVFLRSPARMEPRETTMMPCVLALIAVLVASVTLSPQRIDFSDENTRTSAFSKAAHSSSANSFVSSAEQTITKVSAMLKEG